MKNPSSIAVVGAGVSGLCCAITLKEAGQSVSLFEKETTIGGRVQTDTVDGFLLDRGFQVFLTAYPEAKRFLEYDSLTLKPFHSGAVIFTGQSLRKFADPLRHPTALLETIRHPSGTFLDKLKFLKLKTQLTKRSIEEHFSGEEMTTEQHWIETGFSQQMIDQFLTPFYRGISLDEPSHLSSRMFRFTFAMFSRGRACLPGTGMGSITAQLESQIFSEDIYLDKNIIIHSSTELSVDEGEKQSFDAIVKANSQGLQDSDSWRPVTCLYFQAPESPYTGPWLMLNGSGAGAINQVAVHSEVNPRCSPDNRALISVSLNLCSDEEEGKLASQVIDELSAWFGDQVSTWSLLKTYRIAEALPSQPVGNTPKRQSIVDDQGIYHCGDHTSHASLQGAMESGRVAAEKILQTIAVV